MVGLQVTKANGQPAGVFRALWRALLFQTPKVAAALLALFIGQRRMLELAAGSPVLLPATGLLPWFLIGLLFSTARRRNGFAAAHELASRTRVVRRPERGVRSALDSFRAPVRTAGTGTQRYGPYDVVGTLGSTDVGELVVAFDPSLRRHVWIHTLQPGAVAVAPLVRDLNRPGRLRWLNGQRSSIEAWDAYESLDGAPLAAVLGAPRPWRVVRSWLLDLAREIEAGLRDGPIPVLTIDRVWITADGYAKLLDFRAPGVPPAAQEEHATPESGQTFLASVARSALDGSGDESSVTAAGTPDPLPLAASVTIGTLTRHGFATWSEVVTRTAALQQGPDRVGRGRRAVSLALCALVPVLFALMHLVMLPLISRVIPPDVMALNLALTRLSTLSQNGGTERAQERGALEVYVAGRFQSMIADPRTWETPATAAILLPRRALAERVVADHPDGLRGRHGRGHCRARPVSSSAGAKRPQRLGKVVDAHAADVLDDADVHLPVRDCLGVCPARRLAPQRLRHRRRHGRRESRLEIARALARVGRVGSRRRRVLAWGRCRNGGRYWRGRAVSCGRGPGPRASVARIAGSNRRHLAGAAMT